MIAWLALVGCSTPEPVQQPVTPLRRLTPTEYQNTVADLFPGAVMPEVVLAKDPRVDGFDNNGFAQAPSPLLVEQLQTAAIQVTEAAMRAPGQWLPCTPDGGGDPVQCGAQLVDEVGGRAFRRPLSEEEREAYTAFFDEQLQAAGFSVAVPLTLQALLNAPEFLYLPEFGRVADQASRTKRLTGHEMASRLSYFLWDSMPDEALLQAAADGRLATADGVEAQAWRMLDDPRATQAVVEFHRQWLDLNEILAVAPDPDVHDVWNPSMADAALREVEYHVELVFGGSEPTLSQLLLSRDSRVDARLSRLYGQPAGSRELLADQRSGLLTRAGWLAATSHPVDPSPVQRGVFVLERLLCAPPIPPPADVDTQIDRSPEATEGRTNRERYAAHVQDDSCAGCHAAIDPIGFGFEAYNAVGQFRQQDNGVRIDATGTFQTGDLKGQSFDGAIEMSQLLSTSRTVHDCVALQWTRYALGRSAEDGDDAMLESLREGFWGGGDLRQLLVELVRTDAFRTVTPR